MEKSTNVHHHSRAGSRKGLPTANFDIIGRAQLFFTRVCAQTKKMRSLCARAALVLEEATKPVKQITRVKYATCAS
jgi:hypothetical protein